MHAELAERVLEMVQQRLKEGDRPTTQSPTIEQLEEALIEIARQRDHARALLSRLNSRPTLVR